MKYVPKKDRGKQFRDENLTLVLTFRGVQYQITTRRDATFGYIRAEYLSSCWHQEDYEDAFHIWWKGIHVYVQAS